jgi:hypothetical protein
MLKSFAGSIPNSQRGKLASAPYVLPWDEVRQFMQPCSEVASCRRHVQLYLPGCMPQMRGARSPSLSTGYVCNPLPTINTMPKGVEIHGPHFNYHKSSQSIEYNQFGVPAPSWLQTAASFNAVREGIWKLYFHEIHECGGKSEKTVL